MIFWPCCCDANCRCVGCATLEISGIDSGDYLCDQVVEEAYNRTVVMWGQRNSTETPFELLADPSDCGENYTSYPGTKCKGESYACCQANYSDEPIDPIPLGIGYEVPGTEPGTDCFPAIVCSQGTSVCTTKLTKPTHPTHHYYVDADGYVWLAIVSYEYDVDIEGLQPHIVIIYKSDSPINCSTINSAGASGSTIALSQVCQGLAAESSQCSVETTPLIDVVGAVITLKIYNNVTYCCDLAVDPCNDDEGKCNPDISCQACKDGTASGAYLIEFEGIGDGGTPWGCQCSVFNGSFVLEHDPTNTFSDCEYKVCVNETFDCDITTTPGSVIPTALSFQVVGGFVRFITGTTERGTFRGSVNVYANTNCQTFTPVDFELILSFNFYFDSPFDCMNFNRLEGVINSTSYCDNSSARVYLTTI